MKYKVRKVVGIQRLFGLSFLRSYAVVFPWSQKDVHRADEIIGKTDIQGGAP